MMSAAKAGLKVVDFDPSINNVEDLRSALKTASCKAIYFDPVGEASDNLLLLRKAIPEFFHCKY